MASFMAKDYLATANAVGSMFRLNFELKSLRPNHINSLRLLEVRSHMKMGDDK
jgi:hypothetical protein